MVGVMAEVANRYASVYEEHLGVPRDTEVLRFVISEVSQMISMIQPPFSIQKHSDDAMNTAMKHTQTKILKFTFLSRRCIIAGNQ